MRRQVPQQAARRVCASSGALCGPHGILHRPVYSQGLREGDLEATGVSIRVKSHIGKDSGVVGGGVWSIWCMGGEGVLKLMCVRAARFPGCLSYHVYKKAS